MSAPTIHLGYELGSGKPVAVPLRHLAVTGQTQESGKTTTLEALVQRSGTTALTFITKRGERSFDAGRRVKPYFRDRADWQFVTSILDATLQEKNKFLRPWIMKICRATRTLAEVQERVREALATARGINEGVYTQLDAYLDLIVPEIERADLAERLELKPGLNVMDVIGFPMPMQMLFIQSALDWVNEHCHNTTVVIPEAWEFVPEGKGSPVKASAITLVRKGAGIGNHIWVDSQDMAGVDKVILRGCTVWLIGVQREANELKRNLASIPAGIQRPSASAIAMLERGQFFACFGKTTVKVYVQPAWMSEREATAIARGEKVLAERAAPSRKQEEDEVDQAEAAALRSENLTLKRQVEELTAKLSEANGDAGRITVRMQKAEAALSSATGGAVDMDAIYAEVKRRAKNDPGILTLLSRQPEIAVIVERKIVEIDGATLKGRIVALLAQGFYDAGATNSGTRAELKRTGSDANNANIGRVLSDLLREGFLTLEAGDRFTAVPGMKVNIIERKAAA